VLSGAYLALWRSTGGLDALGVAQSERIVITNAAHGNGAGQIFASGTIYESAAGAFAVLRPIRDEYLAQGGNGGSLGWPTAAAACDGAVCTQQFQGGSITK
jgi:uncharacterized protein with LGFP repeats